MNERGFWQFLNNLRDGMSDAEQQTFDTRFLAVRKTPLILYGFSYFLGWLGVDRFVLGHWGLGLGKLIVGGIIPMYGSFMVEMSGDPAWDALSIGQIWMIVDYFLIGGATRRWNRNKALEISGQNA
ncbi:TM2 domain-containing protein [Parvularcula flava]|uniref:TM2 domain-containing protein n=1 Tax=Aquisalinus luteolus TaxID=1566827 RepID=A0A8J3A288_9PROT|nr:TM2 domain-containing protein [Aquisalinus luteolus]NHK28146.1 TM2 domain-containing protein [Aquisalinus luteolus]GGH97601.1 hypothetical protein GCM10011355_19220 [Aquisalinus luteolus]